MTKHTHYVLTCTKNHTWHEKIPDTPVAKGEHRLCPTCGGSSWIAPDAPKITKIDTIMGEHVLKGEKKVPRKPRPGVADESKTPSPDAINQTKKIPIPTDLIPTRKLLVEDVQPGGAGDPIEIQPGEDFPSGE